MSNPPELITLPNGTQVTEQQYAMVTMAMIGLAERATQGNSDAFGALIDVFFRAESHQLALTPMSQKTLEELTGQFPRNADSYLKSGEPTPLLIGTVRQACNVVDYQLRIKTDPRQNKVTFSVRIPGLAGNF